MKTTHDITEWLKAELAKSQLRVKRIAFNESKEWRWNENGFLSHLTNRFFTVAGIRYFSIFDNDFRFQPIIDQPEIGLLSFVVFKSNKEWWILAHAKAEPGNVNGVQLAPTVQATKSNYEAAHGGIATAYLNTVQHPEKTLYDHLQSEQNSRFLAKRNRNIVVLSSESINEQDSRFKWIRIKQLLPLLEASHTVNTDARSVLTCWLFTDTSALRECLPMENKFAECLIKSIESETAAHRNESIEDWLETLNKKWSTNIEVMPLMELGPRWVCNESEIFSPQDLSLKIHHIAVSCNRREVKQWDQPIARSETHSSAILFVGSYKGMLHLLLQARLEAGNRNGFELTTTVQSETPTLNKYEENYIRMARESGKILRSFHNSEEGGRFDHCISEYQVIWAGEIKIEQEGPFHRWVSLSQFSSFLRMENRVTNELRSAASSLLCIKEP